MTGLSRWGGASCNHCSKKNSVSPSRASRSRFGFPGEIIHKDQQIEVCDLSDLPSAIAGSKLKQLIKIKSGVSRQGGGSTTMVARLTHARLFGTDSPYEDRSKEDLVKDMRKIEREYRNQDEHYLFEEHAERLQLVVLNQGDEPIRDASVSIVMPNHAEFYVAQNLPKIPRGRQVHRSDPGRTRGLPVRYVERQRSTGVRQARRYSARRVY